MVETGNDSYTLWQYARASGQYFSAATNWKHRRPNLFAHVEYGRRGSACSHSIVPLVSSEFPVHDATSPCRSARRITRKWCEGDAQEYTNLFVAHKRQELIRRWDSERELLCSAPRKLPEFAEITQNNAITPFRVIQGHRFWYQSKAHIRFPISDHSNLPPILHRFRDIAVDRSEIAISLLGYPSCV